MTYGYDVMLGVKMTQHSHSNDLEVMTHTLYESPYDSLLRDGWVYHPEGFPMFSYYLFYISVQNSSLDGDLDSNQNSIVPLVNLCTYATLDHFHTVLQTQINL